MKTIKITVIGKLKNHLLEKLVEDYCQRVKPYCKVEIIQLKDEGIVKDSQKILKIDDVHKIILDPDGLEYNSIEFAKMIDAKESLHFVISGPEGLTPEVKASKAPLLSLSKMTFTHEMARVLLLEQIYRGFMILNKKPYHK